MVARAHTIRGYLYVLPALAFVGTFIGYPVVHSIYLSFYRWDGIGEPLRAGLRNWRMLLFEDEILWLSARNTLLFAVVGAAGIVILGFLLAYVVERRVRGWHIFKVVWFLPVILSQTVVAILWARFLEPLAGVVNQLLVGIGLEALQQQWLGDPQAVIYVVGFVHIWKHCGFAMLLLLAAMENIHPQINEAATLDGVNVVQRLFLITLPLIRHVFAVVILLTFIGSLKTFDTIFVLTEGGPGYASTVLSMYVYFNAFRFYRYGYGSAIATFMFGVLFTVSIVFQTVVLRRTDR